MTATLTQKHPNASRPSTCSLTPMLPTLSQLPPRTKCNPSSTRPQPNTLTPMYVILISHIQMDMSASDVRHQTISSTIVPENALVVLKELTTRMENALKKSLSPTLMPSPHTSGHQRNFRPSKIKSLRFKKQDRLNHAPQINPTSMNHHHRALHAQKNRPIST